MPENIFDLTDLSDLPKDVVKAILPKSGGGLRQQQYVDLFIEAGKPLTVNQIRVAYYRRHKKVLTASMASSMLHYLKGLNIVRRKVPKQWELT